MIALIISLGIRREDFVNVKRKYFGPYKGTLTYYENKMERTREVFSFLSRSYSAS